MPRGQRLHVAGGTYYVVQHGIAQMPIFSQFEDYALFEGILAKCLRRAKASVHAYCWTPKAIHLVVQISEIRLGRIMQGVTSRYARTLGHRTGNGSHIWQRYKAVLIEPQHYLLRLLQHVHYIPVLSGLADSPEAAAHTSHHAYMRRSVIPWLTTSTVTRLFENPNGPTDYESLMQRCPAPEDVALFQRIGSSDLHVIGSQQFLERQPRQWRPYRSKASLDQIIHTVTCRMGVERDEVLSKSRRRELSLVRALIAWHASERRVATLSEVARHLNRDASTLSVAISRYRTRRPELFNLIAMPDISPLVPIGNRTKTHDWNDSRDIGDDLDEEWRPA